MCGRYALNLRPSQIRQMLEDDGVQVDDAPPDEGPGSPRGSYNFAPGYHGLVYRADTPDGGAGSRGGGNQDKDGEAPVQDDEAVSYKMQSMKWGLVPFWTKRNPDYSSIMRTINCRDDSLSTPGGMWASIKAKKRCVVIAQGFYEWLTTGPKHKQPHYIKRRDGRLLCLAGLWDMVQYEGSEERLYTYTIITTDSNKQLKFLHDRMPVVLEPNSEGMKTWLDPGRTEWSRQLQSLLKPWDGELDVYPVSKDVGKVGNNSPSFIIPLDSKENKSNIANFFAKPESRDAPKVKVEAARSSPGDAVPDEKLVSHATKRKATELLDHHLVESAPKKLQRDKISATRNKAASPHKTKAKGTPKITGFFNKA